MLLSFRSSGATSTRRPASDGLARSRNLADSGRLFASHAGALHRDYEAPYPVSIFLVVATYALRAGTAGAILLGAAGGLIEDALAGNTGAAWTIATSIAALGISGAARLTFADSPSIFAALLVVAALVREGLYWAVLSLEGYQVGLGMHYTKIAIASALYTRRDSR